MLALVIGALIVLIAAVVAVFLLLLALNIALVRKLRSIMPLAPDIGPAAERLSARASIGPARVRAAGRHAR